jgi:hypothetical protein
MDTLGDLTRLAENNVHAVSFDDRLKTAVEVMERLCQPDTDAVIVRNHPILLEKLAEWDQDARWPSDLSRRVRARIADTPKTISDVLDKLNIPH